MMRTSYFDSLCKSIAIVSKVPAPRRREPPGVRATCPPRGIAAGRAATPFVHGFLRVKCDSCQAEKLVAYSCKRRGFCPSCGARRMVETAALLIDEVLPLQPADRFFVCSFSEFLQETSRITHTLMRIAWETSALEGGRRS